MRTTPTTLAALTAVALLVACVHQKREIAGKSKAPGVAGNILLQPWTGPYGGVPAFDKMDLGALKPALEAGMAKNLAEIDAVAGNPEPPTFQNTIVAMEDAGRELDRVLAYWGVWSANLSTPEFREIQKEMAPKLAEFRTKITQNAALFARIKAVQEGREKGSLRPDQQRLVWLVYDSFARDGATLKGKARERYAAINKRLAELYTQFANNVLADEEGYVLYVTKEQLSGLPDSFIQSAAAAAEERGHKGEYAVTNTRSSMDPFLTYSDERGLREKVWRTYYARGDNGDEHDNNALIAEILQLRNERVHLLGYDSYAAWQLENRMAKTPQRAFALMEAVWPAALARVHEEVADMQAMADKEGAGIKIAPWDYRYYAEQVRRAKYDLDSDEVRQYLQLEKLREAMFFVAGELFNFRFSPVPEGSVPVFHPDVRVWEVTDKSSGDHVGVWYLDPYARTGKRSGAWATTYRRSRDVRGPADGSRLEQLQLHQGGAGRAGAHLVERCRDPVSRVRPCAPLSLVDRRIPHPQRRRARLHGVPVPAPGAMASHRRGDQQIPRPLQDRRTDPGRPRREDQEGLHLQSGIRDDGVPGLGAG